MKSLKGIYFVGVCYYIAPEKFAHYLHRVAMQSGFSLRGVIVCNSSATLPGMGASQGLEHMRGSNSDLDFSGYFEGLSRLLEQHPDAEDSNVFFANDSLFTKHAGPTLLARIMRHHELLAQLKVPAMCGKRDRYYSINLRNPWSDDSGYVASFGFGLNGRGVSILKSLPDDASKDGVLAGGSLADPNWASGVPPAFREQIRAHLLYTGSPESWVSLRHANAELISKKARCVYFEHRLSGAISKEGAIVPVNAGRKASATLLAAESFASLKRRLGV